MFKSEPLFNFQLNFFLNLFNFWVLDKNKSLSEASSSSYSGKLNNTATAEAGTLVVFKEDRVLFSKVILEIEEVSRERKTEEMEKKLLHGG